MGDRTLTQKSPQRLVPVNNDGMRRRGASDIAPAMNVLRGDRSRPGFHSSTGCQSSLRGQTRTESALAGREAPTSTGNSYPQTLTTTAQDLGHEFARIRIRYGKPATLQAKLRVRKTGDAYEQQADAIAQRVMARQAVATCDAQRSVDRGEVIQRTTISESGSQNVPRSVDTVLRSPGEALDADTRAFMEPRFGHDFSLVRIHSNAIAQKSARDLGAHAYTLGHNVVFGTGEFAPRSPEGRRLIAHELAHVVQQTGSEATSVGQRDESAFLSRGSLPRKGISGGVAAHDLQGDGRVSGRGLTAERETPSPSDIQRQADTSGQGPPARQVSDEELKKKDPSIMVFTWGPDFLRGFQRSGAEAQLGDVAAASIKSGFTGFTEHNVKFSAGLVVGFHYGGVIAVGSMLKSFWEIAKLMAAAYFDPAEVGAQLIAFVISTATTMLGSADQIGFYTGKLLAEAATKEGKEFVNSSPFEQGLSVGKLIGRLIMEVALLFIGVGEVSAAAKALSKTGVGIKILKLIMESKVLLPLVKASPEAIAATKAVAGTAKEGSELARPLTAAEREVSGAAADARSTAGTGVKALEEHPQATGTKPIAESKPADSPPKKTPAKGDGRADVPNENAKQPDATKEPVPEGSPGPHAPETLDPKQAAKERVERSVKKLSERRTAIATDRAKLDAQMEQLRPKMLRPKNPSVKLMEEIPEDRLARLDPADRELNARWRSIIKEKQALISEDGKVGLAEAKAMRLLRDVEAIYADASIYGADPALKAKMTAAAKNIDQISKEPAISGTVSIDHIYPISKIVTLDGYIDLVLEDKRLILSFEENLVAMDAVANKAKGQSSWMSGAPFTKKYSQPAREAMITKETSLEGKLQDEITAMLKVRRIHY